MRKTLIICASLCTVYSCQETTKNRAIDVANKLAVTEINLLNDYPPIYEDGDVNAIIEIPAGSSEKWELNKLNGTIERDSIKNKPRTINYLGYPGNYGMIPQTLLSKEKGGDGDPLDIIVIGPTAERGEVLKCKVIGVLCLLDSGEQDDKILAISDNSTLYYVENLEQLDAEFIGITSILEQWFTNYKGSGQMVSNGFGNKFTAIKIVNKAVKEFELQKSNN